MIEFEQLFADVQQLLIPGVAKCAHIPANNRTLKVEACVLAILVLAIFPKN